VTVRVVLAAPDESENDRFRALLGELPGYALAYVAPSSSGVLARLAAEDPEVLVISEDIGPMPFLDLVRQVARSHPFTAVVLLAGRSDPETMRQAMEAGVRGLLPAQFTLADVESRLEGAGAWAATVRRHVAGDTSLHAGTGRILAFCGAKGGVGTSTLALHVALDAATTGVRTCLVDLDLQTGDIAGLLDVKASRDIVDLVDVASDITGRALEDVLYRHPSGIRVLLAPVEGERGEEVTANVARAVLGALTRHFELIVVDCGTVLGAGGATAVSLADTTVTVLTPDTTAVLGARRLHRLWERLGLRAEDDHGTVLVNRVSRGNEVQPDLVQGMLRLPRPPLEVPAAFRALEAAVNTGDPARLVDRQLRRALAAVGDELGTRRTAAAKLSGTSRRRPRRAAPSPLVGRRRDAGQVAVETVGTFTLIAVVCLVLLQGVLLGASYVFASHAAGDAARVAVSPTKTAGDVRSAAVDDLPGQWGDGVDVQIGPRYGNAPARVRVTVRTPAVVPYVGRMFGDRLHVSGSAALPFEDAP
jgi:pilus assembly protein CpaE